MSQRIQPTVRIEPRSWRSPAKHAISFTMKSTLQNVIQKHQNNQCLAPCCHPELSNVKIEDFLSYQRGRNNRNLQPDKADAPPALTIQQRTQSSDASFQIGQSNRYIFTVCWHCLLIGFCNAAVFYRCIFRQNVSSDRYQINLYIFISQYHPPPRRVNYLLLVSRVELY